MRCGHVIVGPTVSGVIADVARSLCFYSDLCTPAAGLGDTRRRKRNRNARIHHQYIYIEEVLGAQELETHDFRREILGRQIR